MSPAVFDRTTRRLLIWLVVALLLLVGILTRQLLGRADSAQTLWPAQTASAETTVAGLEQRLAANPDDAAGLAALGLARLQLVRETYDASQYVLAEKALNQALALDPQQGEALIGQGVLALARHDFEGALNWAGQAAAVYPYSVDIWNIRTDAYVELGRYPAAVQAAQYAVDHRPDQQSYSRVAYLRELHGDVTGAIAAMQMAADAGRRGSEGAAWAQVQLGNLYWNAGRWDEAEQIYQAALRDRPDYALAEAGLARVLAARGQYQAAIDRLDPLTQRLPLPELIIWLGDLYTVTGQSVAAGRQYDLVRLIQQLNQAAGMNVDLEMALFEADHGHDPAVALTQARAAYAVRPGIYGADVLAWALYRAGQSAESRPYMQEALRLGTRDARLYYHDGVIAAALHDTVAACRQLSQALAINPAFNLLEAAHARALLATLPCN